MKKHLLVITTAASILVCGSVAAVAQDDDTDTPNMQQLEQAQQDATTAEGKRALMREHGQAQ